MSVSKCLDSRSLILLVLMVVASTGHNGTAVAQPQRRPQQVKQVAASPTQSPTPSPTMQPAVEGQQSQQTANESERHHDVTLVDDRSSWPSWVANLISMLLLVFVAIQTRTNNGVLKSMRDNEAVLKSQSEALTKQAEVLEKSFRANSRAYVFITQAHLASTISSGDYPVPDVVLKNSGRTPAYRYRVRFEHAFLTGEDDEKARKGIMPSMRPLGESGHAVGSGEFATLHPPKQTWKNAEEREAAIRGLSTYHIWGLICYADIFDEDHSYKFSLYAQHPNTRHLSWGCFGNDAEDSAPNKPVNTPKEQ